MPRIVRHAYAEHWTGGGNPPEYRQSGSATLSSFALAHWSKGFAFLPAVHSCKEAILRIAAKIAAHVADFRFRVEGLASPPTPPKVCRLSDGGGNPPETPSLGQACSGVACIVPHLKIQGGFPVAPLTPSGKLLLGFAISSCLCYFQGAFRSPLGTLRSPSIRFPSG